MGFWCPSGALGEGWVKGKRWQIYAAISATIQLGAYPANEKNIEILESYKCLNHTICDLASSLEPFKQFGLIDRRLPVGPDERPAWKLNEYFELQIEQMTAFLTDLGRSNSIQFSVSFQNRFFMWLSSYQLLIAFLSPTHPNYFL